MYIFRFRFVKSVRASEGFLLFSQRVFLGPFVPIFVSSKLFEGFVRRPIFFLGLLRGKTGKYDEWATLRYYKWIYCNSN